MKRQIFIGLLMPLLAGCATPSFKAPTGASELPVAAATKDTGKHPATTPLGSQKPSPQPTLLADGAVTLSTDPAVAYRINPAHSGLQAANLTSRRLGKRWSRDLGGPVSYPLVAGGKVFVTFANVGSYGSGLVALDEKTGRTVWGPIDLGGTYGFSGAAYDQGRLFVVNGDGLIRSFDGSSGAPGWSVKAEGQYSFDSPPTAFGGSLYLVGAGSGGTLYAFSEASGAVRWVAPVNGTSSSPAVSADAVFVTFACVQADDFNPSTGSRIWHHKAPCSGGGGATAVLYQGKVYARDLSSGNLTLDAKTGSVAGTFSATTNPAFSRTAGYFLSGGTLRSIDLASAAVQWSYTGDGSLVSAPIVAGDTVYTASSSGIVHALNAWTGAVIAEVDTHAVISATDEQNAVQRTSLAVGDGLLIVPAGTTLFAY
jgi:outer membrane protein assembly factor BamB